jgi:hypothetical protein
LSSAHPYARSEVTSEDGPKRSQQAVTKLFEQTIPELAMNEAAVALYLTYR